jgi:uncharacterized protein YqhQ
MAQELDDTIVRRSNGSIDIDFYARRSARLRREAIAATPGVLRGWLAGLVAKSAVGLRKLGPSSAGRNLTAR